MWKLYLDTAWRYTFADEGRIFYADSIRLPSSLDEAGKGRVVPKSDKTSSLSRRYEFSGKAWYRREVNIPERWRGKRIFLNMERTRVTHVFVDGKYVDSCMLVCSPQRYELTGHLTKGKHILTVCVDNGRACGLPEEVFGSHMFTDNTQTNWNGILGKITLEMRPQLYIRKVKVTPNAARRSCEVNVELDNGGRAVSGVMEVEDGGVSLSQKVHAEKGLNQVVLDCKLNVGTKLWSEFHPTLEQMRVTWKGAKPADADSVATEWGLRTMRASGSALLLNGHRVFLRGKHDGCVFPLTGYAPMDDEAWMRYFEILKTYGFNHVRFHSWCPPEAAFRAADRMGFYLQAELPIWGSVDEDSTTAKSRFLRREAHALFEAFGNHPSFVFFSSGNELGGSVKALNGLVKSFRQDDGRFLYAAGSNYHLGWLGPLSEEDIFVSCRKGSDGTPYGMNLRSSFAFVDADKGGMLNGLTPNTMMNYEKAAKAAGKPVIGHETGQFQVYPRPGDEMKYKGVLRADNLETLLARAYGRHGKNKVSEFLKASGALSLLCYKADIETSLRTQSMSGFQMLDLQDYPGQGTALVGLLDAFMDSKGIVSPDSFRTFCGAVVPLLQTPRFVWSRDSVMHGEVLLSNYGESALSATVDWLVKNGSGQNVGHGTVHGECVAGSLTTLGEWRMGTENLAAPTALTLELHVRGTAYRNAYHLWVYPAVRQM